MKTLIQLIEELGEPTQTDLEAMDLIRIYTVQEIEKHLAKVLALDPYTCEIGGNVCLLIDKKDITNIKINLT